MSEINKLNRIIWIHCSLEQLCRSCCRAWTTRTCSFLFSSQRFHALWMSIVIQTLSVLTQIDYQTFLTLSEEDLKEVGVSTFGARRKMLLAISGEELLSHDLLFICSIISLCLHHFFKPLALWSRPKQKQKEAVWHSCCQAELPGRRREWQTSTHHGCGCCSSEQPLVKGESARRCTKLMQRSSINYAQMLLPVNFV